MREKSPDDDSSNLSELKDAEITIDGLVDFCLLCDSEIEGCDGHPVRANYGPGDCRPAKICLRCRDAVMEASEEHGSGSA